jgi:hypothetical protein
VAELSLAIKPNPLGGGSLLVNATQTALLADCGCCKFEPICCCGKFTPVTFTLDFSVTTRFDVTTELSGTIACTQKSACVWTGSIDGSALQPDFGPGTTISNAKFVGTATCNNMPRVDWVGDVSGLPGGDTTVTLNLIGQGIDSGILFSNVPGPVTWIDSFDCDNPLSTGHTLCSGSVTITASADGIDCPDTSCATCPLVLSLTITLGDISLCFKVPKDLFFDCVWFRAGTGQGSTGDGWTIRLDKELDDTGDPIWVLDVDSSLNAPLGHFTAHAAATGDPACPQDASSWTIDGNTFADTPTITVHRHDDDPDTGDTGQPCDCPVDCSHCCEVYAIEFSGTCSAPGTPVTRNFTRTSSCSWQSDTGDTLHCTGKKWIITASLGAGTYHFEADIDGPCPPQNSFAMVGDCAAGANPSVIGIGCASATPQPCPSDCTTCPDTLALTIVGGSNAGTYPIHRSPSLSCNWAADAFGGDPIDIQLSCHAALAPTPMALRRLKMNGRSASARSRPTGSFTHRRTRPLQPAAARPGSRGRLTLTTAAPLRSASHERG